MCYSEAVVVNQGVLFWAGEGGMFFFSLNILIPNVAEKNILILVEEKKKNCFRGFFI
jgi:hypothetical protein